MALSPKQVAIAALRAAALWKLGPVAMVAGAVSANAVVDDHHPWAKAIAGLLNEVGGGKASELLGCVESAFAPGRDPDLEASLKAAFAHALERLRQPEFKEWFDAWGMYLQNRPPSEIFTSDAQPTELLATDEEFHDYLFARLEPLLLRWRSAADSSFTQMHLAEREALPEPLRTHLRTHLPAMVEEAREYVERDPNMARSRVATEQRVERELLAGVRELLNRRPPTTTVRTWNIPKHVENFQDRPGLLEQIDAALQASGATALTALHGLGGIGKSQLVLRYAATRQHHYALGALLNAQTDASLLGSLSELSRQLRLPPEPDFAVMAAHVLQEVSAREPWFLIFDNAETEEQMRPWRQRLTGNGHVLITSRSELWGNTAQTVSVTKWSIAEGADFLERRTGDKDRTAAESLASDLDGLILALEHAAAYMLSGDRLTLAEYHAIWGQRLDKAPRNTDYTDSVAKTLGLSLDRVQHESPLAYGLLSLVAFLAPEVIPKQELLVAGASALPDDLRAALADADRWGELLDTLARFSLVERVVEEGRKGYRVHRLVQQVMRHRLLEAERERWFTIACDVMGAAFPNDPDQPEHWPTCELLMPHLRVLRAGVADGQASTGLARGLSHAGGGYLKLRGHFVEARDLMSLALASALRQFGPDHPSVAACRSNLANILGALGAYAAAREQIELALASDLRQFGPDHPDVAADRSNLANILGALGEHAAAREQIELALASDLRQFGPHHPNVAVRCGNLAGILCDLQDYTGALREIEEALRVFRLKLPAGHPHIKNAEGWRERIVAAIRQAP